MIVVLIYYLNSNERIKTKIKIKQKKLPLGSKSIISIYEKNMWKRKEGEKTHGLRSVQYDICF